MTHGDTSQDMVPDSTDDLITEDLGRFMGTVLGSASIEMDQLIAERVGWWRFRQRVSVAKKAKKLLDEAGMSPKQVPHKTSIPLLEAASLEEDQGLQDRWAALLANAAGGTIDVPPSFASVLRELDPVAAQVLDIVYQSTMRIAIEIQHRVKIDLGTPFQGLTMESTQFQLDVLMRLGVLRIPNDVDDDAIYNQAQLTAFGRSFVKACQPPGTPDPPVLWSDLEAFKAHVYDRKRREAEQAAVKPG